MDAGCSLKKLEINLSYFNSKILRFFFVAGGYFVVVVFVVVVVVCFYDSTIWSSLILKQAICRNGGVENLNMPA